MSGTMELTVRVPTELFVRLGETAYRQKTSIDEQVIRACAQEVGMIQAPIGQPFGGGEKPVKEGVKPTSSHDVLEAAWEAWK